MTALYGRQHRALQERFDTTQLADRVGEHIVSAMITKEQRDFIESRDLFFLSTVDHRGYPTCSYKGGDPGFVRVLDERTLAFPSYDGNGMFLSLGNLQGHDRIGMLFIDFETPHRLRLHGRARIEAEDPLLETFAGAELVVRVQVTELFVNCPRYIHRYRKLARSPYVPAAAEEAPLPQWKRLEALQDVLPDRDRRRVADGDGLLTPEQYEELLRRGEG